MVSEPITIVAEREIHRSAVGPPSERRPGNEGIILYVYLRVCVYEYIPVH